MKVFIFGGTTEGRILARNLSKAGYDITVSVATKLGEEELLRDFRMNSEVGGSDNPGENRKIRILTGRMNCEEMQREVCGFDICVDATHPYAVEATANIKKACGMTGVRYVRLVREDSGDSCESGTDEEPGGEKAGSGITGAAGHLKKISLVSTVKDACRLLLNTEGNVLLATGTKELEAFAEIPRDRLYVRALPVQASIEACEKAGIPHRNIIAMFGPFTRKMNEAVLEQYHISYLVTKESGKSGGFEEKIRAAESCGVGTIVIRRPAESGIGMREVMTLLAKRLTDLDSENGGTDPGGGTGNEDNAGRNRLRNDSHLNGRG